MRLNISSFRLILATFREPYPQPSALHNCPYFAALANEFLGCLFLNEGFDPFLQRGGKTLVPVILPESLEKWRQKWPSGVSSATSPQVRQAVR